MIDTTTSPIQSALRMLAGHVRRSENSELIAHYLADNVACIFDLTHDKGVYLSSHQQALFLLTTWHSQLDRQIPCRISLAAGADLLDSIKNRTNSSYIAAIIATKLDGYYPHTDFCNGTLKTGQQIREFMQAVLSVGSCPANHGCDMPYARKICMAKRVQFWMHEQGNKFNMIGSLARLARDGRAEIGKVNDLRAAWSELTTLATETLLVQAWPLWVFRSPLSTWADHWASIESKIELLKGMPSQTSIANAATEIGGHLHEINRALSVFEPEKLKELDRYKLNDNYV
ncbi:hypothetical protein ACYFX5_26830 [Bremerella sp. T1]|uniref:hypothetical protein n=1 Tax=Bremerella sp. TYQ1 TaxID=3119568 RepID=UPI001CCB1CBA|nr:hypothetical protein [Bremerella volcania]UBM36625.1 hypothetical protein LA756_01685 [Bremerella volcania]